MAKVDLWPLLTSFFSSLARETHPCGRTSVARGPLLGLSRLNRRASDKGGLNRLLRQCCQPLTTRLLFCQCNFHNQISLQKLRACVKRVLDRDVVV